MIANQMPQKDFEIVSFRDIYSKFFEKCLKIFLHALLAMEADDVMQERLAARASPGGGSVCFRFSHPFHGRGLHKERSHL